MSNSETFNVAPYTGCASCRYYSKTITGYTGVCTYNALCTGREPLTAFIVKDGGLPEELNINGIVYVRKN